MIRAIAAGRVVRHFITIPEGVPSEQIPQLDANTIRLAHKAMLWDEAQAKAATADK